MDLENTVKVDNCIKVFPFFPTEYAIVGKYTSDFIYCRDPFSTNRHNGRISIAYIIGDKRIGWASFETYLKQYNSLPIFYEEIPVIVFVHLCKALGFSMKEEEEEGSEIGMGDQARARREAKISMDYLPRASENLCVVGEWDCQGEVNNTVLIGNRSLLGVA